MNGTTTAVSPLRVRGREAGMTQRTTQKETTTMSKTQKAAQAGSRNSNKRAIDMTAVKAEVKKEATKPKKAAVGTKLVVTADMAAADVKKVMRKVSVAKSLGDCRKAGFTAKTESGNLSLHKSETKKGEWMVKVDGKVAVPSTRYFKARRFIKAVMFGIVKVGSKEAAAILK